MRPKPDRAGPGQTSVWTLPRPAIAQSCSARIVIEHAGTIVADTRNSVCTFETSHPPSYYIPQRDIHPDVLRSTAGSSYCEWKGAAKYWDIVIGASALLRAGWSYPSPTPEFAALRDYVAFYAASFDRCSVDGETVIPQPGGFYGGWITSSFVGPFKGMPGSQGW